MARDMAAVILAGGQGSRLRPAVLDLPKPMAPVNSRPFLEYKIEQLHHAGFRDVVFCLGYQAEVIRAHFKEGDRFGVRISYAQETELLDTAGALLNARPFIGSDPFLVLNGDSYCELEFDALIAQHRQSRALVTMTVIPSEGHSECGTVAVGDNHEITGFYEKQDLPQCGFVNCGVYVCGKKVFDLIPPGRRYSLEKDLFPGLCGKGFCAFKTSGLFIDIGTPAQWHRAQQFFLGSPGQDENRHPL